MKEKIRKRNDNNVFNTNRSSLYNIITNITTGAIQELPGQLF